VTAVTSTSDQKDDDVIVITEDHVVPPDEPAAEEPAALEPAAEEAGRHRAQEDARDDVDDVDDEPAAGRPAFVMPGGSPAAGESDERVAADETASAQTAQTAQTALADPWPQIQARFVDDPRSAVEQAAEVTTGALSALMAAARSREEGLRDAWQADAAGTEELRTSLRDYRDLAQRLSELASHI
jgi:hypothetical protein